MTETTTHPNPAPATQSAAEGQPSVGFADLYKSYLTDKPVQGTVEPKQVEQKTEPQKAEVKTETPVATTQTTSPNEEESEEFTVNDIVKTKTPAERVLSTFDDANKVAEKEFGQKDLNTLLSSAKKWRGDSQKLPELQKQNEQYKSFLGDLPQDLKDVLNAYAKGEDYTAPFKNGRLSLDSKIPFEKQDLKQLASIYAADVNVSDPESDDYIDLDDAKSPATKMLTKQLKENFNNAINTEAEKRTNIEKEAIARKEQYLTSVNDSASKLQSLPYAKPKDIQNVKALLESGDMSSLFHGEDGKILPNIAETVFWAKNGEKIVNIHKQAIEQLQSQLSELLAKGGNQVRTTTGNEGGKTTTGWGVTMQEYLQSKPKTN